MSSVFSNPEAELVLLASALEHPEALHQALAAGISASDLTTESNREVWRILARLSESGQATTFESAWTEVQKLPKAEQFTAVLEEMTNPGHMPRVDVTWHVKELKGRTQRRQLVAACERASAAANDPSESTADCIGYLAESLLRLEAESHLRKANHLRDFMPQVLTELESRSKCEGLIGLPTGIAELDEATTGLRPSELWICGALPGRGKTALGAQIALANVETGTPVAFFSLEMSREQLGERFLSNESRVSASRIRNPRFIEGPQWTALVQCVGRLEQYPLYVDDSTSLNIETLIARAKLYVRRFGCKLVIVDYLRLVQASGDQLRERVGNVAEGLRQLAKSENISVVALSQLSRPKDGDINSRPNLLQLKESGDVEASAHTVLLIYMPMRNDSPASEDEIIIGKNRNGPIGSVPVLFSRDKLKFHSRLELSRGVAAD
jgi:replicative DNA helicase